MDRNVELMICLMGKICSGKSTVAKMLSEKLMIPRSSFGGYLINYSNLNGLPTDRNSLQDLGEKLISLDANIFLKDTVKFGINESNKLILDGVRHKVIFEEIKNLAMKSIFIYIEADDQTRFRRYLTREKTTDTKKGHQQFMIANSHSVEQEIESLKQYCDIIINSEESDFDLVLSEINSRLV